MQQTVSSSSWRGSINNPGQDVPVRAFHKQYAIHALSSLEVSDISACSSTWCKGRQHALSRICWNTIVDNPRRCRSLSRFFCPLSNENVPPAMVLGANRSNTGCSWEVSNVLVGLIHYHCSNGFCACGHC